jgi:hypothetical protein
MVLADKLASSLDSGSEALSVISQSAKVTLDLQTVPELRGLIEECAETDGHGRRNGALARNDLVDGATGHANGSGHGVLGDTHGDRVFVQQDLTGSKGWLYGWGGTHGDWVLAPVTEIWL